MVDGIEYPVWNSVHPLIPMFLECYSSVLPSCKSETETVDILKCLMLQAEKSYNTCMFGGDEYYRVLCLHVAAGLELAQALLEYRSMKIGAAAAGRSFSMAMPKLYEGFYGQMLLLAIEQNTKPQMFMGL